MLNKPKLFFVDACRGSLRSRVKIDSMRKQELEKQEKNDNDNQEMKQTPIRGIAYDATGTMVVKHNRDGTKLSQLFHNEANCRFIYANPEGYAAIDGGKTGGYLIQATKHVFNKKNEIENENLDSIINQIRLKTRQLVGKGAMQNVQDVNHMNFNVYFKKC